ncbi:MAG: CDP-alcohol phosphatidyltransferase family protein, partial [Planctomycetota bacterium]
MQSQLPNILTVFRFVLAAIFFVVMNQYQYQGPGGDPQTATLLVSFILFVTAALTDLLDGYLARKWQVESRFGRIMDPMCDKILVLGALMYLAGPRFIVPGSADEGVHMISGFYPWMVVVILTRELLVTSIRGELEGAGSSFGANLWGKLKMVLQSVTIPTVIVIVWIDP